MNKETKEEKYCPFVNRVCLREKCMAWRYYKDEGYCAMASIFDRL